MSRPPRSFIPGVPLHIIQRGNDRAAMFAQASDYQCYLDCAAIAARRFGVAVHAYVLMTNHVHMLATPGRADSLPRAMHWLGSVFVQHLNVQHRRSGSRVEGRYKCRFLLDEAHFLACMHYIEANPLRAGMAEKPEHYRWSSYHANACGEPDPLVSVHPLFVQLGLSTEERRRAYRGLFATSISEPELEALRIPDRPRGRPRKSARPCNGV